ncbi:MAG: hypothetical protein HOM25_17920, partial [Rhodospirillaceae bacterium]|nr:hypothetical protein [Rhodospirillaceae bacterium]
MKASKFQKKHRSSFLFSMGLFAMGLFAMGLFILGAPLPAHAQDLSLATLKDTREFSSRDRLIDTFMAEDQATVDGMIAALEGPTADALETLDKANRKLHLAELDASGTRMDLAKATAGETRLQSTLDKVTQELVSAQETLVTLQELSPSKENAAAITNLETELRAEISTLQKTVEKARTRLHKARYMSWRAKTTAKTLKSAVDDAQVSVDAAQGELHAIRAKIDPKYLALRKERATVTALAKKLSREQLLALNWSLDNAGASGLHIDLDSYHLHKVLDGRYDRRQISAMTKSLASAAKYLQLAEKTETSR